MDRRQFLFFTATISTGSVTAGCMAMSEQRPDLVLANRASKQHTFKITVANAATGDFVLNETVRLDNFEQTSYADILDIHTEYEISAETQDGLSFNREWTQSSRSYTLNIALTDEDKFTSYVSKP